VLPRSLGFLGGRIVLLVCALFTSAHLKFDLERVGVRIKFLYVGAQEDYLNLYVGCAAVGLRSIPGLQYPQTVQFIDQRRDKYFLIIDIEQEFLRRWPWYRYRNWVKQAREFACRNGTRHQCHIGRVSGFNARRPIVRNLVKGRGCAANQPCDRSARQVSERLGRHVRYPHGAIQMNFPCRESLTSLRALTRYLNGAFPRLVHRVKAPIDPLPSNGRS
jgi:hypothetical protein